MDALGEALHIRRDEVQKIHAALQEIDTATGRECARKLMKR